MKPVILTGLRANNDLHIGNYFGALLPFIDMAKTRAGEFQLNLFVPDLHSFTTPIDHSQLQDQIMHNLRLYVAAGLPLDQADIRIYRQSYIPAHSELTVILDSFTGMGEMNRMTQYKDKSRTLTNLYLRTLGLNTKDPNETAPKVGEAIEKASERISVGLFNYPVLMAADILLYEAVYVPVGDDQSQHLEFTRDVAERMNRQFGELFVVPKAVKEQHEFFGNDQGLRIKDLADPAKKMSKSDESNKGIIFLGDNPEDAAKKIMGATTDSFGDVKLDFAERPGISNLLQIHALLSGRRLDEVAKQYEGVTSYGDLKKDVAEGVKAFLTDFQARLASVDDSALLAKLEADEVAMNEVATATLYKVQQAVGLRPKG